MTVKEIIEQTTTTDLLYGIQKANITLFYEEFKLFMDVYEELKNSDKAKPKFSLAFFDGPFGFPHVLKVHSNGRRDILVPSAMFIANCDILDKTEKLSEIDMLTYLILHFVALLNMEKPYEFLARRHDLDLMDE